MVPSMGVCIACLQAPRPGLAGLLLVVVVRRQYASSPQVRAVFLRLMLCLVMLQAISNSLWSYSKLGYNPGHRVLDIAARRAAVMLHQYTSQEIANTLWAFATLEQNPGSRHARRGRACRWPAASSNSPRR